MGVKRFGEAPSSHGFVPTLELGDLTLRFLAGAAVALLDLADQLVVLAFDDFPVIVGQATPLLFGLAKKLLPIPFDLIAVHLVPLRALYVSGKHAAKISSSRRSANTPRRPTSALDSADEHQDDDDQQQQ